MTDLEEPNFQIRVIQQGEELFEVTDCLPEALVDSVIRHGGLAIDVTVHWLRRKKSTNLLFARISDELPVTLAITAL